MKIQIRSHAGTCFCRPMFCLDCLGKVSFRQFVVGSVSTRKRQYLQFWLLLATPPLWSMSKRMKKRKKDSLKANSRKIISIPLHVVRLTSFLFSSPSFLWIQQWFVSKQNERVPERWLQGSAECPTCRTPFTVQDISFVSSQSQS